MLPQREKGRYAKILKFTIASTIPTSRTTKDCFCCGEEHVTKRALQNANYKLGFGHHFPFVNASVQVYLPMCLVKTNGALSRLMPNLLLKLPRK
jgi:hypothetical protein